MNIVKTHIDEEIKSLVISLLKPYKISSGWFDMFDESNFLTIYYSDIRKQFFFSLLDGGQETVPIEEAKVILGDFILLGYSHN